MGPVPSYRACEHVQLVGTYSCLLFLLSTQVTNSSRELSKENTTKLLNDVNRRIFDLIHSHDNNDRIGGILAIDKLIDYTGEESHTKITRLGACGVRSRTDRWRSDNGMNRAVCGDREGSQTTFEKFCLEMIRES